MFSSRALSNLDQTVSTSFSCDLKKWFQIMKAYEEGGHAYHATMPTDSIAIFLATLREIEQIGFAEMSLRQEELGNKVRNLLGSKGYHSVSAEGYQSPGVVVSYTSDSAMKSGTLFTHKGLQISAGVPLFCDEGNNFSTFRIGLFGIEKLSAVDETVAKLALVLDSIQTK
jgi:aspartate aminotransferase-like enzyme